MRVSLLFTALLAFASSTVNAQCPFSSASCPATPVSVPTPWYNADFSTDPRLNPAVGGIASAGYGWVETAPGDSCAQFHRGLAHLQGVPAGTGRNNSDNLGPHIDLGTASGPYSIGTTFPGLIGGRGSGDIAQGTRGWSFEITVRPDSEGPQTEWAKFVNLGTSARRTNNQCNGEWLLGWQGGSDSVSMGTCVLGREDKIENFLTNAPNNQWMHFVSVLQYSASVATYFIYYNGNLIGSGRQNSQQLVEIFRDRAYLGRSSWPDQYFNGTIDQFSIYDIALTAPQVRGLYGEKMTGCTVNRAPYQNMTVASEVVAPFFDASFTPNITTFPSVPADFSWVREDPEDVPCGVNTQHQGLLALAGDADWTPSFSSGPFVNLSSTGGENYIGQTIPVFGNVTNGIGNLTRLEAGFSIEVMFKASFQNPSAKIFSAGNGNRNGECIPGDIWAGWLNVQMGLEIKYCDRRDNYRTIVEGTINLQLRTWYHLVITFSQMPDDNSALVNVYLNGQPIVSTQNQAMLPNVYRTNVLLGRSQFFGSTDTYFSGMIDRFAIYNRSLSSVQVANLANTAGTRSCVPTANTLATVPTNSVFYRLAFDSDPRGPGAQYGWAPVDVNDTATDQAIHRGVLLMGCNGCMNNDAGLRQWVNLTATTGPNALTNIPALDWFGGEGNGNFNTGTKGWTFEASFKIYPTRDTRFNAVTKVIDANANGQGWAKLFDFGDGNKGGNRDQCENDVIYGFNGGDPWMKFQVCTPVANDQSIGDATTARRPMKVNTWYHLVATLQLVPQGTNASLYLDGELIENRNFRVFPLLASRSNARLGDSSWDADPFFNGALDMFTIYSQAVNQQQVRAMYVAANTPSVVGSSSSSSTGTTARSSSSSSSAGTAATTVSSTGTTVTTVRSSSSSSTGANVASSSSTGVNTAGSSSTASTVTSVSSGTSIPSGTSVPATSVPSGTSIPSSTSVPATSLFSSTSSSSAMVYPDGSVIVSMNAILPETVTPSNFDRYRNLLKQDIVQNLANITNVTSSALNNQVEVTRIGDVFAGARRLLQAETPVAFVILGTISNAVTNFGNDAAAVATRVSSALADRVQAGQFTATNTGGSVPAQSIDVSPANGDDIPNSAASLSQSFALAVLCMVIALMAL